VGSASGMGDRVFVVVEADDRGARVTLGDDDRQGAVAAAHIGHTASGLQPVVDAVERGDPRAQEVRPVSGFEESPAPLEHVVTVLVTADTVAGEKGVLDALDVSGCVERNLEAAGDERGACLVGEHRRLLGAERIGAAVSVVANEAAGRLGAQPFADIPLGGPGPPRELGRSERPGRSEGPLEAEAIADHDERGVDGRAELNDGLAKQRIQPVRVDSGIGWVVIGPS
jgi:hypothetical protein